MDIKEMAAASVMGRAAVLSAEADTSDTISAFEQQSILISSNQPGSTDNAGTVNSTSLCKSFHTVVEDASSLENKPIPETELSEEKSDVSQKIDANVINREEVQVVDDAIQEPLSGILRPNETSHVSESDSCVQPEGNINGYTFSNVSVNSFVTSEGPSTIFQVAAALLANPNKQNLAITSVSELACTDIFTEKTATLSTIGNPASEPTVTQTGMTEESEARPGHSVMSSKVEPVDRDSSDSGLGSAAPDSDDPDDNTFLSELVRQRDAPRRSNLKRKHENEPETSAKREKRSVRFDCVTVLYFPRAQGFSCVPSQGGSTLGMERRHTHVATFTLAEHAIEQRRAHRVRLQQLQAAALTHSDDSSDSDSDSSAPTTASDSDDADGHYLQPLGAKQRRAVLRAAGVRRIDPRERDSCRDIRASRELCGCACRGGVCAPPLCACSRAGVTCQVDRMGFPCGCTRDTCSNPAGRLEFNPLRVQTHFVRTLVRLGVRPPHHPLHPCSYPDGRYHTYAASTFEEFAHPAHLSMFRYEQLYAPPVRALTHTYETGDPSARSVGECSNGVGEHSDSLGEHSDSLVEISRQANPHERAEDVREHSCELEQRDVNEAENVDAIVNNIVESAVG